MSRFSICQKSEYVRSLNVAGFWICQVSEYTRVLNIPGFTQSSECVWISLDTSWICLIMSQYDRMLNTNSTLLRPASVRSQFPIFENSAKKICTIFAKRSVADVWQDCEYAWGPEYIRVLNMALVLNMPWLLCTYHCSEYTRVLNVPGFWICQDAEYIRLLNMPGF